MDDHSTRRFRHKQLQLEYTLSGKGSDPILAFHGFGRTPEDFNVFHPLLNENQCLVSIYLFQHGESRFPESRIPHHPLSSIEFAESILALLEELGFGQKKFSLLGYSLGGKVCLNLCLMLPDRINKVILLAPDGLKINQLYRFSSNTLLGRSLYRLVLHHPEAFFKTADLARWAGIVSEKVHRFVLYHMNTFEKRKQVHDVWLIYRDFNPDLEQLKKLFRSETIKVEFVFGKYDQIITPQIGKRFVKDWGEQHLHILEIGHLLLTESTREYLYRNRVWFD